MGSPEQLEAAVHGGPDLLTDSLKDRLGGLGDSVPELPVLRTEDEGSADGLGVVRRGGEREDLLDDLGDTLVGNLGGVLERVDTAATLGGSQELGGGNGGHDGDLLFLLAKVT